MSAFTEGALAEGREGMVTAYDHDGRYVGCIGRETWRWLIDHPEVDAPALIRAHEMEAQARLDAERAAILSAAVGRARLLLNDASKESTALIDAALSAHEEGS